MSRSYAHTLHTICSLPQKEVAHVLSIPHPSARGVYNERMENSATEKKYCHGATCIWMVGLVPISFVNVWRGSTPDGWVQGWATLGSPAQDRKNCQGWVQEMAVCTGTEALLHMGDDLVSTSPPHF